jgi:hypothetical protein
VNTNSSANSSSTSTAQLVSNHMEVVEGLAHIKDHVKTIKEAISTLEDLDKVGYVEDLITLRKELAGSTSG